MHVRQINVKRVHLIERLYIYFIIFNGAVQYMYTLVYLAQTLHINKLDSRTARNSDSIRPICCLTSVWTARRNKLYDCGKGDKTAHGVFERFVGFKLVIVWLPHQYTYNRTVIVVEWVFLHCTFTWVYVATCK